MNFKSLNNGSRLDPDELAKLCALFATGVTITELASVFNMSTDTAYELIRTHYFGYVPADRQVVITLQSKMNIGDP